MATAVVENEAMTAIERSPYDAKALGIAARATAIHVSTVEDRGDAAELGRAIAQLDKEIENFFKPIKESAFETHRKICGKEKELREPLEKAKKHLSKEIGSFDQEQERLRREEEARLQEEARQEAIREAEKAAQENAINDAIACEAEGDSKTAAAILNNPAPVPVFVPPVIVERQIPKTAGVSTQKVWKFRITDPDLVPREYCIPDEKAIGNVVKGLKGKTNIPGVQVYEENGARFRA